eukprot:Pgem_evm1s12442
MQTKGLRVKVVGNITAAATATIPATLAVSQILSAGSPCPTGLNMSQQEPVLIMESGGDTNFILIHGSLMLAGWGFLLPLGNSYSLLLIYK